MMFIIHISHLQLFYNANSLALTEILCKKLQNWLHLQEDAESGPVPGFGKKLSAILNVCLSE